MGPRERGLHRWHLGGLDDRSPARLRYAAVVHGRPFRRRGVRRLTDGNGDPRAWEDRSAGATYRLDRGGLALGPGSWRLAVASLARPYRYSPTAMVSGWLPRGLVSTEPLKDTVRRVNPSGTWAPHPHCWPMAVDYRTGQIVAFGRQGSPPANLPDAVAASCAIPGFYRAVEIGGRSYIDGGVHSTSNLDVLCDEPVHIVVALNPMSSLHVTRPGLSGERLAVRMQQRRDVGSGRRPSGLRTAGKEVILIQPTVHDLDVMGGNLIRRERRHDVIETAVGRHRPPPGHAAWSAARTIARGGGGHLIRPPKGHLKLARLPRGGPGPLQRRRPPPHKRLTLAAGLTAAFAAASPHS